MCKAIDEMMAKSEQKGLKCGIEQGIQGMIRICRDFGASKETTLQKIITEACLSPAQATEYLQKYWI